MKSVKYHTVGTFPKSTRKIVETQTKSIFLAHKYTCNWVIHNVYLTINITKEMFIIWKPQNSKVHHIQYVTMSMSIKQQTLELKVPYTFDRIITRCIIR
jgi:hypothetical protein